MKLLLLAAALFVATSGEPNWPPVSGYDLGNVDGSSFSPLDREVLPAAQDGANILDIWILPALYLQYGSGGHSQLESMRYYAYGRSYRSNHTYLDNIDVTDPFNEGQPMITVPWGLWSGFHFSGLRQTYGEQLGVTYYLSQPHHPGFHGTVESSFIHETGGGTLIPPHTLDGEPGSVRGAPAERRHLVNNYYVGTKGSYCGRHSCYWLALDYQELSRTYLTHDLLDAGDRLRVATGFEGQQNGYKYSFRLLYEGQKRPYYGGEYRLNAADLANQESQAVHGQVNLAHNNWDLHVGYTFKEESLLPYSNLERIEISTWRGDSFALPLYGQSRRHLFQTSFNYHRGHHQWRNTYLLDGVEYDPVNRTRFYSYLGQAQWIETFTGEETLRYHRHRFRTWYNYDRDFKKVQLIGQFGLYAQSSIVQGGNVGLNWLSPYGHLEARFKISPKFFITMSGLTDVPDVPFGLLMYANSAVAHSTRSYWFDTNNNGTFDTGEGGQVVRQGGGDTHELDESLQPAREWELFIGFGGNNGKKFSWRFNIIERFYSGRYMVMYDESQRDLFTSTAVKDPMGTVRGAELSLSGQGQDLTAFIKDTALWGKDRYVLENDNKVALYQGIELQLMSAGKVGFFNLSGAAYWLEGYSPYGNGPAYNDFMAIDEESADPNWQVNQKGRLDGCRALGLNIIWGLKLFSSPRFGSLFFASATRYRDGEPFSRIYVANLPQGATPIMANWRAGVRYTYNMSCDLRLAYRLPLGISTLWIYADIYNLLDSTAEMTEYAYTGGNFRQALESIPPRTFMLKLKISL